MGNFVVYETDERMFFLKKLLTGLRPVVNTHIFAPNLTLSAERLEDVGEGEALVCGRLDEGAEKLAECKRLTVRRISENEKFQAENPKTRNFRRRTPASPRKARWRSFWITACSRLPICGCW